jgi:hypothetical protein
MPIESTTAEKSVSVLIRLKIYARHDHQLFCLQYGAVGTVHGSGFPI